MRTASIIVAGIALTLACCKPSEDAARPRAEGGAQAAPTNRVDIPDAVRRNLGMTFAKVESRNVARTLRVPGRFELLPTAEREYRAPLAGRVELLVAQYQRRAGHAALPHRRARVARPCRGDRGHRGEGRVDGPDPRGASSP